MKNFSTVFFKKYISGVFDLGVSLLYHKVRKRGNGMVYTITLNPSIDYLIYLDTLSLGEINRSERAVSCVGGKGINVSVILARLGEKTSALGFAAGYTGKEIGRLTEAEGVLADFVETSGESRINVKIFENGGVRETAINGRGPVISAKEEEELCRKVSKLTSADTLVISGAEPASISGRLTENIIEAAKNARIIVDVGGGLLMRTLKYRPFLMKPNSEELSDAVGKRLESREEIIEAARKLQSLGAENVLVSLGERGAMLLASDGEVYEEKAVSGEVKSTVGAGDSMLAGFIKGYSKGARCALRLAVAVGSETAFSEHLADRARLVQIEKEIFNA